MSVRLTAACVTFLAILTFTASGCSESTYGTGSQSSDDEARPAVRISLQALEHGRVEEAVRGLLGEQFDPSAWQRTEKTLAFHYRRKAFAEARECAKNLKRLVDAIELYRADEANGFRLPRQLNDLVENTMETIPKCPSGDRDTYSPGYRPNRSEESYSVACKGHYHKAAGMPADTPRFDPRFGTTLDRDETLAWWPDKYHAEIDRIDRLGSRATVRIRETSPGNVSFVLSLHMKKDASTSRWTVDTERYADEVAGDSHLGLVLSTYRTATVSAPAIVAGDPAECERKMRRVATALEMYSCDHEGRYPRRLQDLVPGYLPSRQICASDAKDETPVYRVSADATCFELTTGTGHPVHLSNRPTGLQPHGLGVRSAAGVTLRQPDVP